MCERERERERVHTLIHMHIQPVDGAGAHHVLEAVVVQGGGACLLYPALVQWGDLDCVGASIL